MTILEAIERAKRMRAERARGTGDTEPLNKSSPVRRAKLEVAAAPVATLNFPRLDFDPAVCEKNRILIVRSSVQIHARAVDSYRILRTRLRSRLVTGESTSFGIISAGPDEGKSLTALNLALSFAIEKKRNVFLIDLDLRNPSLCRYLGISPKAELGNCLAHLARPEEVFFNPGVDNLVVAGGITSHENLRNYSNTSRLRILTR
jgi:hypothetical protein